jgi:GNAT superfamily N-acetyltransferase
MVEETSDLNNKISLRPVKLPDDEPFLKKLYFSTREEDFKAWEALGKEQAEQLMQMQFTAQTKQYRGEFPDSDHKIILFEKKAVGRLWANRNEREICCIDIAVLSEYRGFGIGTVVLRDLIDEAARTNRVFTLHVLKTNPAIRLYLRLGCEIVAEDDVHFAMEWQPKQ